MAKYQLKFITDNKEAIKAMYELMNKLMNKYDGGILTPNRQAGKMIKELSKTTAEDDVDKTLLGMSSDSI